MLWLFIYVLAVSLYDLRTGRIPNWYTLPVIIAGLIAHFPGSLDLWMTSFAICCVWGGGWMGTGDAKLWLAVLWALPLGLSSQALPMLFATFFLTSLVQIVWGWATKQTPTNTLSPAAWRTIPFVLWFWYVH